MKKSNKLSILFFFLFVILLGLTIYTGIGVMAEEQEVVLQKITVIYDENSGVLVNDKEVTFNDKNQTARFKTSIKNTQNYDIKISDIKLSTPTEKFLEYKVETLDSDILKAGAEKEIVFSLETTGINGWGRNFNDKLTANISFEKVQETTIKKEEEQPVEPAANTEELLAQTQEIEVASITTNAIEFKENFEATTGDKIAVWLYSEPIFLGYFDVVEINGAKQIVGLEEALQKVEVEAGEHNLALVTEVGETIGYINVYVDEKKELSEDKKDNSNDNNTEENIKEENIYQDVENPNTSDQALFIVLIFATAATGITAIILSKNGIARYSTVVLLFSMTLTLAKAQVFYQLPLSFNVNFQSQNIMKKSYVVVDEDELEFQNYWTLNNHFKNFYIKNEIIEIPEYIYRFDASEEDNGRVMAYVVDNKENTTCKDLEGNQIECYDLYLVADGIIYPNNDAGWYFDDMINIDLIDNLNGMDTSETTDMTSMFNSTGYYSTKFKLDLSNFDTSSATTLWGMFHKIAYNHPDFTLDVSNFDTSNVTDMANMFSHAGYNSTKFTIDISNFDTSKVTDMAQMFWNAGYTNPSFTLNLGQNFKTNNVTDMSNMFNGTGCNSKLLTLDVSGFDTSNVTSMRNMFAYVGHEKESVKIDLSSWNTSKVTDMAYMFFRTGYNSKELILNIEDLNTSKVTNMRSMFNQTGYSDPNFILDVSHFDTSKVEEMTYMFFKVGYNSTKLNTTITIKNPGLQTYDDIFVGATIQSGTNIKVNYTQRTEKLVDRLIAEKSANSSITKGTSVEDLSKEPYLGDEVNINGEIFNIIELTDVYVTLLAKYNLGPDYKQSTVENYVSFSSNPAWEYAPGPKEVDISIWSPGINKYVTSYVNYLKTELNDQNIKGDIPSLKDLEQLGCTYSPNYAWIDPVSKRTCTNSIFISWLANGQPWWTKSSRSDRYALWRMEANGDIGARIPNTLVTTVRPTITISRATLEKIAS